MKKIVLLFSCLLSIKVTAQTSKIKQIEEKIINIEEQCKELLQIAFHESDEKNDAIIVLTVCSENENIYKITEEITLENTLITSVINLENNIPIKITTTEENYTLKNELIDYDSMKEVFKMVIHVKDWENDEAEITTTGTPVKSDGVCSMYEYYTTVENVKNKLE